MNRVYNIKVSLFLMVLILITNCSRFFDYEFQISNETQSEINVTFVQHEGSSKKSIKLEPYKTTTILIATGYRCNPTNCVGSRINTVDSTLTPFIKDLEVFKDDSIEAKTNFNNEYNWEFESRKSLGIYTAKINEEDF